MALWHEVAHDLAKKHAGKALAYLADKHPIVGGALVITGLASIIHLATAKKTGPSPDLIIL